MILRLTDLDPEGKPVWQVNAKVLLEQIKHISEFDESLRYDGPALHLVGGKSRQYPFSAYKKVLRGITEKDVKVVEGAGHLVHMDKPEETVKLIGDFLKEVD